MRFKILLISALTTFLSGCIVMSPDGIKRMPWTPHQDYRCEPTKPPSLDDIPEIPVIPKEDWGNHKFVEEKLVSYILKLHKYTEGVVADQNRYYKDYRAYCEDER